MPPSVLFFSGFLDRDRMERENGVRREIEGEEWRERRGTKKKLF